MPPLKSPQDATASDAADIPETKLEAALDGAFRDSLRPIAGGLAALFAVFAVAHALLLPKPVAVPMAIVATVTASSLLAFTLVQGRRPIPAGWSHPIGAAMASIILLNSLLHLYLTSDPGQSTNVSLVIIGAGCFFLSSRWLAIVIAMALGGWAGAVVGIAPSPPWRHFAFTQLGATAISVLVHTVRMRVMRRIEHARIQDERLKTELDRAIHVARRSEERFRRLSEATFEGIVVHESGKILDANRALAAMFGCEAIEVVGRDLWEFVEPKCREPFKERVLSADGKPFESLGVRNDGSTFPIEVCTKPASPRDRNSLVTAIRDNSERKRAEEALRETEERFRLLVEGVKDYAIFRLDPEGRVLSWNAGAERIKGYRAEEIIGRHFSCFYPNECIQAGNPQEALRVAATQGRFEEEGWRLRKDGSRYLAHVVITALRDEAGDLRGFAKVTRDITEQRKAEEALREAAELERRTSKITLLSQLGSLLQTCMTVEEAYNVFAQFAPKLFPGDSGALFVLGPSRNLMEAVALWGDFETHEQVFDREDCWALRSGRLHFVESAHSGVVCRHVTHSNPAGYVCVPMVAQGDALGILHLLRKSSESRKTDEAQERLKATQEELIVTVAEQVGLALANLKLRETLRMQSVRDPLTGLFNRRYLEESLERELRRADRSGRPLGGILLDIDHFKRYNDTFGHEAGDNVLRELGNFLQSQVRGEDIACRFGGEEFMLILPDAALEATRHRAEQLREGVKHLSLQFRGQSLGTITLSLGVAVFPQVGKTVQAVIRAVDEALYQAKSRGRDRVVVGAGISD